MGITWMDLSPNLNCLRNSYTSFVDVEENKKNVEEILVDLSLIVTTHLTLTTTTTRVIVACDTKGVAQLMVVYLILYWILLW